MTRADWAFKGSFDVVAASTGLILAWPVIVGAALLARWDTGGSGIFRQIRVGRHGRPFTLFKIRTMKAVPGTTVTTARDSRITPFGMRMRRWKLDELPQLWNVLKGDMSFVGPRPDVPGYADRLNGDDAVVLRLRPGITGPATLKYRDEEQLLAGVADPQRHNDEVIWPDKVRINRAYIEHYRFRDDLRYLWQTVMGK